MQHPTPELAWRAAQVIRGFRRSKRLIYRIFPLFIFFGRLLRGKDFTDSWVEKRARVRVMVIGSQLKALASSTRERPNFRAVTMAARSVGVNSRLFFPVYLGFGLKIVPNLRILA